MIRRLALAAVVLTMAACSSATAGSNNTKAVPGKSAAVQTPLTTVVQVGVPGQAGKERREVVRDAAAWRTLWAELRQDSSLAEEPPAVDFDREMVIVAAMETQSCVSRVTIRAVTPSTDGAVVDLLEEPPAPNCRCIVAQRPIHAVRLEKIAGTVRFTAERGQMSCGGGG